MWRWWSALWFSARAEGGGVQGGRKDAYSLCQKQSQNGRCCALTATAENTQFWVGVTRVLDKLRWKNICSHLPHPWAIVSKDSAGDWLNPAVPRPGLRTVILYREAWLLRPTLS